MSTIIGQFNGQYRFLSNFYEAPFLWRGLMWRTSENAYQAAKSLSHINWVKLQNVTPGEAKRFGRSLSVRPDWEEVKFSFMVEIITAKFRQNPVLLSQLLATGDTYLEEGNTWGDRIWGVSPPGSGNGKNWLGLALMAVRAGAK